MNFDNLDNDALDLLYGFDEDEYASIDKILDDFGYSDKEYYDGC